MEYLSTQEAALRWALSVGLVEQYCQEGYIPGAQKRGDRWMIPRDAHKPSEPKQTNDSPGPGSFAFPLDDTCIIALLNWQAGDAEKAISGLPEEASRLFEVELTYYRGQDKAAKALARDLLKDAQHNEIRLACLQTLALCAVYSGSHRDWTKHLRAIAALPSWRMEAEAMKELSIAAVRLAFLDLSTVPQWLRAGDFGRLPTPGSFQAVFVHIKFLQSAGKLEAAKHALKIALTRREFIHNPVARTYLELTLAAVTHSLNDDEAAKGHLRIALKHGLPDGLYGILAENTGSMDSLLKEVMLTEGLDGQLKHLLGLYESFKAGWMRLGQHVIGEQWVTDLTPREWEALKHAASGLSTAEIAARMSVSVPSVKKYLGAAYDKLRISGRTEMKSLLPRVGTGETHEK